MPLVPPITSECFLLTNLSILTCLFCGSCQSIQKLPYLGDVGLFRSPVRPNLVFGLQWTRRGFVAGESIGADNNGVPDGCRDADVKLTSRVIVTKRNNISDIAFLVEEVEICIPLENVQRFVCARPLVRFDVGLTRVDHKHFPEPCRGVLLCAQAN